MRLLPLSSLLACATLALHVGCVTPPRKDPSPTEDMSMTNSSWQHARVGDHVAYSFSANHAPVPGGPGSPRALAGRLVLEVVAVEQPWAWLRLSFTDEAGQPLKDPRLARAVILPVHMEASRPLDVPREGTESAEQVSAIGRTWEARRYIQDMRPADGPLENRLYAMNPGPLYLTHGLLSASTTLSGFGASGGIQLTLVEASRGPEAHTASAAPALERPLGPGTWYDVRMDVPGNEGTHRTCLSAERGYLLLAHSPAPSAGTPPCPSFAEAEAVPLAERLLGLLLEAVAAGDWPPPSAAPSASGTFSANGRSIPSLTFEATERSEIYAQDPWDASLAGLAHEARFRPLAEGTPESSTKLTGWGTWLEGTK